tara:strand:+ start:639 stop:767 length:129 start_codon:yes stop_codon:yes gene_type:complete
METFEDESGIWEIKKVGCRSTMVLIKPKKAAPKKKAAKKSKK